MHMTRWDMKLHGNEAAVKEWCKRLNMLKKAGTRIPGLAAHTFL